MINTKETCTDYLETLDCFETYVGTSRITHRDIANNVWIHQQGKIIFQEETIDRMKLYINELIDTVKRLNGENEKLRECVEFYEKPAHWFSEKDLDFNHIIRSDDVEDIGTTTIFENGGKRARKCLKQITEQKENNE